MCFEILGERSLFEHFTDIVVLGFDIMIDEFMKPYLIEVNHSPSFSTDSPLDLAIKTNLIRDSIIIMNLNPENK